MKRMLFTCGLAMLAGLAACGDTTEPEEVGEVRIAHLAPGAGSFDAMMDSRVLVAGLPPLQFFYRPVVLQPHTYAFRNDSVETSVTASHTESITATVLMNPAEPEARTYELVRTTDGVEQRIMIINADTAAAGVTVVLEGPDSLSVTLAPGEGEAVEPAAGEYAVQVQRGDAEPVSLQAIQLFGGDHGFLAVYPAAANSTLPLGRLLF